ncbi:Hpt domain-containing protein [Vibrio sp. Of7-15]|uniref:Hpt domain-containing protein n=1 Tax=Vibrio sp. Of7-15 TaxID=2724879 RepID=UPI001EF2921C|nr:Hpt domain-containing protein [Vibrio sp. Of7-15]MCG7495872.1 Hpt domain-containing protein [Vibrio sp. Of7-15]
MVRHDDKSITLEQNETRVPFFERQTIIFIAVLVLLGGAALSFLSYQNSQVTILKENVRQLQSSIAGVTQSLSFSSSIHSQNTQQVEQYAQQFDAALLAVNNVDIPFVFKPRTEQFIFTSKLFSEQLDQLLASRTSINQLAQVINSSLANQDKSDAAKAIYLRLYSYLFSSLGGGSNLPQATETEQGYYYIMDDLLGLASQLPREEQQTVEKLLHTLAPLLARYSQFQMAINDLLEHPTNSEAEQFLTLLEHFSAQYYKYMISIILGVALLIGGMLVARIRILHQLVQEGTEAVQGTNENKNSADENGAVTSSSKDREPNEEVLPWPEMVTSVSENQANLNSNEVIGLKNSEELQKNEPTHSLSFDFDNSVNSLPQEPTHSEANEPEPLTSTELDISVIDKETVDDLVTPLGQDGSYFCLDYMMECMGGDLESVIMLLEIFIQDHSNDDKKLAEAIRNNESEIATRIAHSLKGVAGSIGAEGLKKQSELAEKTLKSGGVPEQAVLDELAHQLSETSAGVMTFLEAQTSNNSTV